jgi:mannose/cellobiose epimerase-like protein (N-acyl-D-glucosamine 2-epimerase family)
MGIRRLLLCVLLTLLTAIPSLRSSAQGQAQIIANLPAAAEWKRHLQRDILPFWETPAALGNPVGSFPSFRCNDGSVTNPQAPCAEFLKAPDWIKSAVGRQYVRMISRQIYLYGVAFHMTGDEKYLVWARAGVRYIIDHAFNNTTGGVASYWQGGTAFADSADQTSQDLSYALVGLSFYYYLTRDPSVLQPILRIENYIRQNYYDSSTGLYRWKLKGADAGQLELVAQLDQANAYMLLLTPLLPQPHQNRWRAELAQIARTIRDRFYDPASTMFLGVLDPKPPVNNCIYARDDTDFGHTVKTYWMHYFIGRVVRAGDLTKFAAERAPGILQRAYLPATGSWATQPTCNPKPDDLDRTSTWWMAAELDQAALSLGIADSSVLTYVPKTYDFWLKHMVDTRYGEVWDEVTVPDYTPRLPKVHLWKNGFHTAEHALVGAIATSAIRSEPVELYYAFQGCKLPSDVRPYYYDGQVTAHTETALPGVPGFCRVKVTFANVR